MNGRRRVARGQVVEGALDEIRRAFPYGLVGDAQIAAACVTGFRLLHTGSLTRQRAVGRWRRPEAAGAGGPPLRLEVLVQHQDVSVRVVQRRQADEAFDVACLPVKRDVEPFKLLACGVDVFHAERQDRPAARRRHLLHLRQPDGDPLDRRPELCPANLGKVVPDLEAEACAIEVERPLEVGDSQIAVQTPFVPKGARVSLTAAVL